MNLEDSITRAGDDLRFIIAVSARISRPGTLLHKSYNFFDLSLDLSRQLEQAAELIAVRDVALNAARAFPRQASPINPGKFMYNEVEVGFKQGRYLVLQSYLATTWALYDSISKIAGVLCCLDDRAKNPTIPMKLAEDFLRGKNCVGSRVQDHLKGGYGRPIAISYAIRNWVVHDGHSHRGQDLFESDGPTGTPYRASTRAWEMIEEKVAAEYNTRLRPFPDIGGNLLEGLVACHKEVDEAVGFLLAWSAGGAKLQADILLPRDVAPAPLPVAAA